MRRTDEGFGELSLGLGLVAAGGIQLDFARESVSSMDPKANSASPASWCARGLIVTVSGPGDARISVRVPRPFVRIGGDRRAEVRLPLGDLLPCHLYLHATERGIYCLGLSDSAPSGWLCPKTRVEIGPYRIQAIFDDAGSPAERGAGALHKKGGLAGLTPRLLIDRASASRGPVEFALDRRLSVIGRRSPSNLRFAHRTVSRVHCALYWSGEALWAIDLLSANGTLLNLNPIDAAVCRLGDELNTGRFRIQFLGLETPPAESPASQRSLASLPPASESDSSLFATSAEGDFQIADSVADSSLGLASVAVRMHDEDEDEDGKAAVDLEKAGRGADHGRADASRADHGIAAEERGEDLGELVSRREPSTSIAKRTDDRWRGAEPDPSGRQLAVRNFACGPPDDRRAALPAPTAGGALSQAILQALSPLVEQAGSRSELAVAGSPDPNALAEEAFRQLIQIAELRGPERLLERELSMVCLTLVKARQTAEKAAEAPELERLIDAIRSLERRIAQLAQADPPRPAPALVAPAPALLSSPRAAADVGETRTNDERHFTLSETRSPGKGATEGLMKPASPDQPGAMLDDRMLERLVDFKAKRDAASQRQRLWWSVAAAIAIVLIIAVTGAAKLLFYDGPMSAPSGDPPAGDYPGRLE